MKWPLRSPLTLASLALLVSGCGGKAPPAASAQNGDESGAASDGKSVSATSKGDSASAKCTGFDIPDLLAMLAEPSCELPDGTIEPKEQDVKDALDIRVSADQHVAPGSRTKVRLLFKNKGKTDLPLTFVVDPEARFTFELSTPKGARVDRPAGAEPALPPEVSNAPTPDKKYARVTIAANGTAGLSLSWDAVKTKWASKEKAKGAVPGRGYPREPAGPLAPGKYVLRVITPLVGVFEGVDHEISQPRTDVVVGGR
jgi:hypothetical protein